MEEPNDVVGDRLLRELLLPKNNSSNVTFAINAGGVGVWFATAAALICFILALAIGFMYVDLRREQQRTQDHISVIYQLIPDMRKMVNEELCRQGRLENCKITDK